MSQSPYASIQNEIVLPYLHSISIEDRIFKPISNNIDDDKTKLSEPLLLSTNSLVQELNHTFKIFQDPKHFNFKFPESMFPEVTTGQKNNIRYEQKIITEQENTFKDRLSQSQIKQIQEKGEFKVKSNIEYITLPYVWKINETLFWGKTKIQLVWKQSLSKIFGFFWSAKNALQYQFPRQLSILKQIPKQLFSLFFGSKSIKTVISVNYDQQIKKDFWNKIMSSFYRDSPEWCSALWNYLYVEYDPELARPVELTKDKEQNEKRHNQKNKLNQKYFKEVEITNQKIDSINNIHDQFNQQWNKLKKRLIIQVTEQVNGNNNSLDGKAESQQELLVKQQQQKSNDQKILQRLSEKKFTLYVRHLEAQLPKKNVPLQVINAIVFLLRLFNVIGLKQKKRQNQRLKRVQLAEKKFSQKHKIKSLFQPYFHQVVRAQMQKINIALEEQLYKELLNDKQFTSSLSKDQITTIKQFIKFKSNYQTLIEAKKKQKQQYHGPTRIFYSNYRLLPPYKVLRNQNYYSLKKISDNLTVDTRANFWKLKLYWMRLKTWTINCLVTLAFSAWKGPFGLRCLWGVKEFNYETNINYQTGQLIYETRNTVIGTFLQVLDGITKSRQKFQETPDLGLLGKNVSRFFNYIQCYLFRFIFVGILITLICYPILIIVLSTLVIIFVVTFWAWIPLIMVITYLFNILIKQFQTPEDQYGFFSRTFPIIRIILSILQSLGIILLSVLNLILLAPIKTLFLFLFSTIQNLFRKALDSLMLLVFQKLGRTPSRDTPICKKISGPGMSKEFYMSINEDDVYVLIQANLEQIYIQQYDRLIREKIEQNGKLFTSTVSLVLSPFSGSYYSGQSLVIKNKNKLLENYHSQYTYYMKRYPNNPYNVRFTQEQIDNYFQNTVNIVKKFVQKKQISKWIFERYELYQGMYDELTRSIWISIFGCGQQIFEPLEKLDMRFKLQDQYANEEGFNRQMKKGVGSVMRALQGQVELFHNHKKLTPFKHNLLNRQFNNDQVRDVFILWRQNSIQNVSLGLGDVRTVFIPNLNIKSIIIVEDESRQRQIASQEIIIDL